MLGMCDSAVCESVCEGQKQRSSKSVQKELFCEKQKVKLEFCFQTQLTAVCGRWRLRSRLYNNKLTGLLYDNEIK